MAVSSKPLSWYFDVFNQRKQALDGRLFCIWRDNSCDFQSRFESLKLCPWIAPPNAPPPQTVSTLPLMNVTHTCPVLSMVTSGRHDSDLSLAADWLDDVDGFEWGLGGLSESGNSDPRRHLPPHPPITFGGVGAWGLKLRGGVALQADLKNSRPETYQPSPLPYNNKVYLINCIRYM